MFELLTHTGRNFGIIEGIPTCSDYYYLNDNSSTYTKGFWILPDGSVRVENRSTDVSISEYCIHFLNIHGRYQLNLRVCPEVFNENTVDELNTRRETNLTADAGMRKMANFEDLLYRIYFVTGATFLALTLLVYAFILKQRTSVFDKILSWHVGSLFVCYSTMAFDKIVSPSIKTWICKPTGM